MFVCVCRWLVGRVVRMVHVCDRTNTRASPRSLRNTYSPRPLAPADNRDMINLSENKRTGTSLWNAQMANYSFKCVWINLHVHTATGERHHYRHRVHPSGLFALYNLRLHFDWSHVAASNIPTNLYFIVSFSQTRCGPANYREHAFDITIDEGIRVRLECQEKTNRKQESCFAIIVTQRTRERF